MHSLVSSRPLLLTVSRSGERPQNKHQHTLKASLIILAYSPAVLSTLKKTRRKVWLSELQNGFLRWLMHDDSLIEVTTHYRRKKKKVREEIQSSLELGDRRVWV